MAGTSSSVVAFVRLLTTTKPSSRRVYLHEVFSHLRERRPWIGASRCEASVAWPMPSDSIGRLLATHRHRNRFHCVEFDKPAHSFFQTSWLQ